VQAGAMGRGWLGALVLLQGEEDGSNTSSVEGVLHHAARHLHGCLGSGAVVPAFKRVGACCRGHLPAATASVDVMGCTPAQLKYRCMPLCRLPALRAHLLGALSALCALSDHVVSQAEHRDLHTWLEGGGRDRQGGTVTHRATEGERATAQRLVDRNTRDAQPLGC
jgi:hypothetical protein